jgi:hypothetical protein
MRPPRRYGDGLTNRLLGSVAEDTFRTPIPTCDDAIEVLAYDCIVTGLDDRCQPIQSLLTFAKSSFDLFDHRNVAINLKYGVITEQLHPAVYNDFAAILADMA